MAYSFDEAVLSAAVKSAISDALSQIPNQTTKMAIEDAFMALVDLLGDEFELIDAEI